MAKILYKCNTHQKRDFCGVNAACVLMTAGSSSSSPVKQVLSANRAANTAAWPSSGARILDTAPTTDRGHGDRLKEEQEEDAAAEAEAEVVGADHSPIPRFSGGGDSFKLKK